MKLTILLLILAAVLLLFFQKFTRNGAVPLKSAWRSFTVWLSAAGLVLGQYIVDVLQWLASIWEPFREQFGDLLAANATGQALQILSAVFFVLRMKGQGFPKLNLPDPDSENETGV